jgi:hypothetical protein
LHTLSDPLPPEPGQAPPEIVAEHAPRRRFGQLVSLWNRLPPDTRRAIERNFLPEDPTKDFLPGEKVQLEIKMAWYRDLLGHYVFHFFGQLFLIVVLLATILWALSYIADFTPLIGLIPFVLFIIVVLYAFYERLEYLQWRLIKTNARLIISIPIHNQFPFVDTIELKNMPTVIDTNWSTNPWWRVFQMATGARDLYLSLVGYQFTPGSAKVRDALVIPDVMPNDVYEFRKLIFNIPSPQPVQFLTPQKVITTDDPPDGS